MSFYRKKEVNCISCLMVRKIFFYSEFVFIPENWWRREEKEKQLQSFLLFKETPKVCITVCIKVFNKHILL